MNCALACKVAEGLLLLRGRFGDWNVKEVDFLNRVQLISAKPVVYLVNLTEKAYIKKKSKWLPKVRVDPLNSLPLLPYCAVRPGVHVFL